ncbi:hypothetical protein [Citreimonas salinaria]|uniref:SLOG domain-containing protein n=1 Tax=Citreimonas salinaria TaxID=321339 RepID=UPI002481E9F4|nr:hypothetical protein [Citreimonas salinaria]
MPVEGDMDASLEVMRRAMFRDYAFHAAVFVGGMEGVIDEFDLLRNAAPNARLVPIPAPGGVSRELFERVGNLPDEMSTRTDFTYWLYRLLDIDPSEPRILAGGSSDAG